MPLWGYSSAAEHTRGALITLIASIAILYLSCLLNLNLGKVLELSFYEGPSPSLRNSRANVETNEIKAYVAVFWDYNIPFQREAHLKDSGCSKGGKTSHLARSESEQVNSFRKSLKLTRFTRSLLFRHIYAIRMNGRHSNKPSCLESTLQPAVLWAPVFQLIWAVIHAGVGSDGGVAFDHFGSCK